MTTPVLQTLHASFPMAVIDIIADRRSGEFFKHCPFRGEIFYKEKEKIFRGGWSLLKTIRARYYDLIVDLRTDGFAYLLRGNKRLTKWHRCDAGRHSVEQHMSIINSICFPREIPHCHIWLSDNERYFADQIIGVCKGKKILGLGLGANSRKKVWPPGKFISLIQQVQHQYDAVVLFGNKRDQEYSEYIYPHVSLPCINLCGETTLLQAAAVLGHIELYIGNDSGLGHMASAMGKPTITIFGPGNPERYRPWGDKAMWLAGENQKIENVNVQGVISVLNKLEMSAQDNMNLI